MFCPPAKMVRVSGTIVAWWILSDCWVWTYCGCAIEIDVGKLVADVSWTTCWPSTVVICCGSTFICKYVPGKTRFFVSIWAIICWSLLLPSFTVMGKKHLLPDDKNFKSCNVMDWVLFAAFATAIVFADCRLVTIRQRARTYLTDHFRHLIRTLNAWIRTCIGMKFLLLLHWWAGQHQIDFGLFRWWCFDNFHSWLFTLQYLCHFGIGRFQLQKLVHLRICVVTVIELRFDISAIHS